MRNIDKLKQYIKETANQIRITRAHYKEAQRDGQYNRVNKLLRELHGLRYEYRHHHIAYCELKGRTMDEIETIPTNPDKHYEYPNRTHINELKNKYAWTPDEIEAYTARKDKLNEEV